MSFPGSFSSQLAAVMEALLKAVVTEVTALVEDGAVELRLELRDRERQILERERDIEERDRVIEELRAALEELTARGEEATARTEGQEWTKEEESESVVKHEPSEEFPTASENLHESLWPPPPLPPPLPITTTTTTTTTSACEFDESCTGTKQETTQSFPQYFPETETISHFEPDSLPLDSLLHMNQEKFYPAQHGFSFVTNPAHEQATALNRKRRLNVTQPLSGGGFRCDQCGKTFTVKWRLATHQSVHTGAKPYSCRKCGKRFSRRDNCVRHEKTDARCKDSPGKG